MRFLFQIPILLCTIQAFASEFAPRTSGDYEQTILTFFDQHCMECHDEASAKAGLNLEELSVKFVTEPSEEWIEIMDAINLGEMPPEEEPRPDAMESFEVVKWIAAQLTHSEKAQKAAGGQIPMRRLNRDEFTNTVRDLLHLDQQLLEPIAEDLPGDGKAEGFDRLGVALFFDQTQIERTIAAAEQIAGLAIVDPTQKPESLATRFEPELLLRQGGMGVREAGETSRNEFTNERGQVVRTGELTHVVENDGVRFVQGFGNANPMGRMGNAGLDELVIEDGYYRVRARVGANPGTRGEPISLHLAYNVNTPQEVRTDVTVLATLDDPEVIETVIFLRRGSPDQRRRLSVAYNNLQDYIISSPEAQDFNRGIRGAVGAIRDAKRDGDTAEAERQAKILEETYERARAWEGPLRTINPKYENKIPPQIFIDWLEFEGPLKEDWPPKSHQQLLFDGDERRDIVYAREIVAEFLPRAYRRPVTSHEVDRIVSLIGVEMEAGADFYAALRIGLTRILTSPGFLFIKEPSTDGPRTLTEYELATRLSYFLWSTMPDEELFDLAERGELSNSETLTLQVTRMLTDPNADEFVENFAGQWLSVREFGSITPAENLYRDYDSELEAASKQEAYAFFGEVLRADLPITNFLDSDFVMINERLARHYEIEGIEGDEFRRVALRPEHHRGGVFGMAGLMTLLADGTRTLPVRRAAWTVETLFNDPPPPPPPNAGEVQPNTEGEKLTVRERLERHRNEPTCASCHATLDPYGLALENYDAIGRWRTRQNGENFRDNGKAPELDVSGQLPSGRKFATLEEFKAALLDEKDQFAHAFSERMLTYALGRPVGYSDRETVQFFVETLRSNEYRIQPLIQAVVASEVFNRR
ncbi:MAG: DUF1592 domain-containing protein [Verrucomicrobiota bacterium]